MWACLVLCGVECVDVVVVLVHDVLSGVQVGVVEEVPEDAPDLSTACHACTQGT